MVAPDYGYGIVAMAALGYGGPWLWQATTDVSAACTAGPTVFWMAAYCDAALLAHDNQLPLPIL